VQCDGYGHFKCRVEDSSKLIKLTFTVEDNLDEFIQDASLYNLDASSRSSSPDEQPLTSKQ